MAIRTLKIGSSAQIKNTNTRGVITEIQNGRYRIGKSKRWLTSSDLVAEKTSPAQKPRSPINKVSPTTKALKSIYEVLRFEYLLHNKLCRANLPGCTGGAQEIHHMAGRQNFWLIISKYFLPICRKCHKRITKNSNEAIQLGLSVSRSANISYEFCEFELQLLQKYGVSPP